MIIFFLKKKLLLEVKQRFCTEENIIRQKVSALNTNYLGYKTNSDEFLTLM